MSWPCLNPVSTHSVALLVSVIPNAKRTEVVRLHDGCLRVRLHAQAIEGRANAALIDWLASQLGVPKRAVTLAQGQSSRRKRVIVECPLPVVEQWLDRLNLPSGEA